MDLEEITQIRDCVRIYFFHESGDGRSTSLWYDNWLPEGPISISRWDAIIRVSGLGKEAVVSDIIVGE